MERSGMHGTAPHVSPGFRFVPSGLLVSNTSAALKDPDKLFALMKNINIAVGTDFDSKPVIRSAR
jgi:hypothetical protein